MLIEVSQADITTLPVDGLVNAANTTLLGGGGVDGAIHRAAGPELLAYCRTLGGCDTGQAKLSPGYKLPAKYVIHTVGPIYQPGDLNQATLLRSCYLESLIIAHDKQMTSVAFPAISTGVYGYPKKEACEIAVDSVRDWQAQTPSRVIFCCFDAETTALYEMTLQSRGISGF